MRTVVPILTLIVSLPLCLLGQPPIDGYITLGMFNGHAYYLSMVGQNWVTARDNCVAEGGHLVCIGSATENQLLTEVVALYGGSAVWIGFSDVEAEGIWTWVNGEPVGYDNWNTGEPDNAGNEDVARLVFDQNGHWSDAYHDLIYTYILEVPELPPPPAPENLVILPIAADVHLHWNAVDASDIIYHVYSDSMSEGPFQTLIGTTADTAFVDSNALATPDAMRYYRVTAAQP